MSESIRAAIVSPHATLRETARAAVSATRGLEFAVELTVPLAQLDDVSLAPLRAAMPDIVLLDLTDDPALALRFAHFLLEQQPRLKVVGLGATPQPELLLEAMRTGIAEIVPAPVSEAPLAAALERLLLKIGGPARGQVPGKLFTVLGAKGGVGATAAAVNLAVALQQLVQRRTLLVDLDLELGDGAVFLGVQPRFNFVDLVQNYHRLDAGLLASFIERHPSGVDLLSAPYQPEKAESPGAAQIRKILLFLKQHYDHVLIDTPRSFGATTIAALEQSDLVLLVTAADLPSLRNVQRMLPLLRRVLPHGDEQIRLVVNRYDARDVITLPDIERTVGLKPYWTFANDYETVAGSVTSGTPAVLVRRSAYARDVRALCAAVTGLAEGGAGSNGRRFSVGALLAPLTRMLRRRHAGVLSEEAR